MNPQHHRKLTARFLHATRLPADRRSEFLERLRLRDSCIVAEVESLLGHEAYAPEVLRVGDDVRDETVGPYHLLERIAQGGMGIVYRAKQSEPIEREVAVKLIRAGLESTRILARFEAERRVLARMDHPNIARVLDAGQTAAGRPYFAMEYVRGVSITEFCDTERLDVSGRLGLFLQVCDGVQYAHQNAILHRDLKPSNVLVAVVDGRPVPKIIDFGIAKALGDDGPDGATLTEIGALVGTPAYMSPEQASTDESNPDTRSDVYSLGALLYKLLVGRTPLELPSESRPDREEIRRVLRREEPLPPSVRVRVLAPQDASEIAVRRGTDPSNLARQLRGDLDAITGMALAKERDRRYASVAELAGDVRRVLGHEPIHARPPSIAYRLSKLVRRHRTATAVVVTLAPALVLSAVLLAFQARRVALERDRAEEVSELLVRAYELPFQYARRQGHRAPEEVLRQSLKRIESELDDRPTLQARMLASIGEALRVTGDVQTATPVLERAAARLRDDLGADDPRTLAARYSLARAYGDRQRRAASETELVAVLDSERRILGDDHVDTLRTMGDLALLYGDMRRIPDATRLLESVMEAMPRVLGEEHDETQVNASMLAGMYIDLGRTDDAYRLLQRYLPKMRQDLPERRRALYNLARTRVLRGERETAIEALRGSMEAGFRNNPFADPAFRSLSDDPEFLRIHHLDLLHNSNNIWRVVAAARDRAWHGRYAEAETLYRTLLRYVDLESRWGLEKELARFLIARGRFAEGEALLEHAMQTEVAEGAVDALWIDTWHLVQAHIGLGERDAALALLDEERSSLLDAPLDLPESLLFYLDARRAGIVGDEAAALQRLREALDHSFESADLARDDLAFRELHRNPEFRAIVDEMERRSTPVELAGIRDLWFP